MTSNTCNITCAGSEYPVREVHVREFGSILISTTQLECLLVDFSTDSYISDDAKYVDEQICYYVAPDEIYMKENELIRLLESELDVESEFV